VCIKENVFTGKNMLKTNMMYRTLRKYEGKTPTFFTPKSASLAD